MTAGALCQVVERPELLIMCATGSRPRENNDLDIGENKDFTFSPGVTLLLGTCRINRYAISMYENQAMHILEPSQGGRDPAGGGGGRLKSSHRPSMLRIPSSQHLCEGLEVAGENGEKTMGGLWPSLTHLIPSHVFVERLLPSVLLKVQEEERGGTGPCLHPQPKGGWDTKRMLLKCTDIFLAWRDL